ncbi:hypothetical protein GGF37_006287, partial [Kickxella alabastrina]
MNKAVSNGSSSSSAAPTTTTTTATSIVITAPIACASSAPHSKGTVTKSTSSFVSRLVTNENLARWVVGDTPSTNFIFNAPRCMTWMSLQQQQNQNQQNQPESSGETLARLDLVSNTPLCHSINPCTRKSNNRLDIIMGFTQGNLIWYDPVCGKYSRLNKNSGYTSAVLCVAWIPGSETLFMAGMADGCLMIVDRTRDEFVVPKISKFDDSLLLDHLEVFSTSGTTGVAAAAAAGSNNPSSFKKSTGANPVTFWRVSNKPITSISFAPTDNTSGNGGGFPHHVAVTCEDGGLRIIDYLHETLHSVHASYFGGLTCSAWSPDSRFVIAGGKDDLLSIWSTHDCTLVARCEGHESWVRSIAFDPLGHGDENTYRFMSVGEDGRLLVWDFSLGALHRPRGAGAGGGGRVRGNLPVVLPLVSVPVHGTAVECLRVTRELIVTACRRGIVR